MRLLVAIPYYAPAHAFGGSVTVAETLVREVVAAGHDVTVATTDVLSERERIALEAPAVPAGATVVRFPNLSHRAAVGSLYLPRGLRAWVRANVGGFDLALLLDFYSAVSVSTARAASRAGVPFALQPLGTLSPATERGRSLPKRAWLAAFGRRTLREASALVYSSEHERADFLAAGAPAGALREMPLPLELPSPHGTPRASEPTACYVGRLHEIKGIDRLIEAVAIARQDVPGLILEIVGPGDRYRAQLEQQAARLGLGEAVRFHGFVSAEERTRQLERAHVFCLLSRSEGLPMAALEAMASGTPVLLSRGCHLDEVEGVAGAVVDGSPEATARALTTLLVDSERRQRLARGALEFSSRYRRERVMPHMLEMLESLARS
jgi:glycosyltransferase involved in cell wall biosynthesis